jgi:hypothetical protein
LDLTQDGTPIGVDFMLVSQGVDVQGLPNSEAVAEALAARKIPVRYRPALMPNAAS